MEVALIACGLGEELRPPLGVVLVLQPAPGQLRIGQSPRQRQLACHRGEDTLAVQQGEVARIGFAEVLANVLHGPPAEQYRRDQCQHARQ
ncbi:hypothetical protein D3C80_459220 [compost metagenome]